MIKGILMDFNGVIIDDEPLQMQAYREVLGTEGVEVTEESYLGSLGMDEEAFVRNAYAIRDMPVPPEERMLELIAAKQAMWREMIAKELPLFPGMTDFVERMAREFTVGIVSMAPDEIDLVLDRAGLTEHFPVIVSADDVSAHKPDPEGFRTGFNKLDSYRTALGHLPMTHGECLAIEDSPPGIVAARTADLHALGITNTVDANALHAAGAGAVATDLRDWMPETVRLVFA